jgi:hypothetical protein
MVQVVLAGAHQGWLSATGFPTADARRRGVDMLRVLASGTSTMHVIRGEE